MLVCGRTNRTHVWRIFSGLLRQSVSSGILARHAVDRGDINKCVLTVVSSEPLVLKTDKTLESMEAQLITSSKILGM